MDEGVAIKDAQLSSCIKEVRISIDDIVEVSTCNLNFIAQLTFTVCPQI